MSRTGSIYHNININEARQAAQDESQQFLETYYVPQEFPPDTVWNWCALARPSSAPGTWPASTLWEPRKSACA